MPEAPNAVAQDTFPLPPPDARPFGAHCPGCGRDRTADDASGVAWSSRHTADGPEMVIEFVCPTCTRADLAQIEAGLPTAHHTSAA